MDTTKKCKNCQNQFITSWFNQKGDYSKLSKVGYNPTEIKKILPLCSKCLKDAIDSKKIL